MVYTKNNRIPNKKKSYDKTNTLKKYKRNKKGGTLQNQENVIFYDENDFKLISTEGTRNKCLYYAYYRSQVEDLKLSKDQERDQIDLINQKVYEYMNNNRDKHGFKEQDIEIAKPVSMEFQTDIQVTALANVMQNIILVKENNNPFEKKNIFTSFYPEVNNPIEYQNMDIIYMINTNNNHYSALKPKNDDIKEKYRLMTVSSKISDIQSPLDQNSDIDTLLRQSSKETKSFDQSKASNQSVSLSESKVDKSSQPQEFRKKMKVIYTDKDDNKKEATIISVHTNDEEGPYYTINVDDVERQTDATRLSLKIPSLRRARTPSTENAVFGKADSESGSSSADVNSDIGFSSRPPSNRSSRRASSEGTSSEEFDEEAYMKMLNELVTKIQKAFKKYKQKIKENNISEADEKTIIKNLTDDVRELQAEDIPDEHKENQAAFIIQRAFKIRKDKLEKGELICDKTDNICVKKISNLLDELCITVLEEPKKDEEEKKNLEIIEEEAEKEAEKEGEDAEEEYEKELNSDDSSNEEEKEEGEAEAEDQYVSDEVKELNAELLNKKPEEPVRRRTPGPPGRRRQTRKKQRSPQNVRSPIESEKEVSDLYDYPEGETVSSEIEKMKSFISALKNNAKNKRIEKEQAVLIEEAEKKIKEAKKAEKIANLLRKASEMARADRKKAEEVARVKEQEELVASKTREEAQLRANAKKNEAVNEPTTKTNEDTETATDELRKAVEKEDKAKKDKIEAYQNLMMKQKEDKVATLNENKANANVLKFVRSAGVIANEALVKTEAVKREDKVMNTNEEKLSDKKEEIVKNAEKPYPGAIGLPGPMAEKTAGTIMETVPALEPLPVLAGVVLLVGLMLNT